MMKVSLLVILVLGLLFLFGCTDEESSAVESTVIYPDGWEVSQQETNEGTYVKLNSPGGSSVIIISMLSGYDGDVKQALLDSVEPAELVVEKQRVVNSKETIYFEIVTLRNEPLRLGTYTWVDENYTYVLTYMAQEDKYPVDLDDFKVVLNSMTR